MSDRISSDHLQRGKQLLNLRRPDQAVDEFRAALRLCPDDDESHAFLSISFQQLGRWVDAVDSAKSAIGFGPDNPLCHYAMAAARFNGGEPQQAEPSILEAIRLWPSNADYFGLLSQIHAVQGNWRAAGKAAALGLQIDPNNTLCHVIKSMTLLYLNRFDDANQAVMSTLSIAPNDAMAHAIRGYNALANLKLEEAETSYREALRLDANYDFARDGLMRTLIYRNVLSRWLVRLSRTGPQIPTTSREKTAVVIACAAFAAIAVLLPMRMGILMAMVAFVAAALHSSDLVRETWTYIYRPIGLALISFRPLCRPFLTEDEYWLGRGATIGLVLTLLFGTLAVFIDADAFTATAAQLALLSITWNLVFQRPHGAPRHIAWSMFAVLVGLAIATLVAAIFRIAEPVRWPVADSKMFHFAMIFLYVWGATSATMQFLDRLPKKRTPERR